MSHQYEMRVYFGKASEPRIKKESASPFHVPTKGSEILFEGAVATVSKVQHQVLESDGVYRDVLLVIATALRTPTSGLEIARVMGKF
jgi:hypothetical protein